MSHKITLERNTLRFAAAHFTTGGGGCEPLHGHNYDVLLELTGALTDDAWVVDFGLAKQIARDLCQELDHKFILQARSKTLSIRRLGQEIEISHGERRYVMPASDVVLLETDNTSAERLAEWFAYRVLAELGARGLTNVTQVKVGVEEMPGQAGWFSLAANDVD
jgi:6-pyruvoyltetrahydropterin/6-carboxytetrahydropterin synthase